MIDSKHEPKFNPENDADKAMLEIFAQSSKAKNYYDSNRFIILLHMHPELNEYAKSLTDDQEYRVQPVNDTKELRRILTNNLVLALHLGAEEIFIPHDSNLTPDQIDALVIYLNMVNEASLIKSQELIDLEPKLGRLTNPLGNPELIGRLWRWNKQYLPDLLELINFTDPA